jgi:hypothetical protein
MTAMIAAETAIGSVPDDFMAPPCGVGLYHSALSLSRRCDVRKSAIAYATQPNATQSMSYPHEAAAMP